MEYSYDRMTEGQHTCICDAMWQLLCHKLVPKALFKLVGTSGASISIHTIYVQIYVHTCVCICVVQVCMKNMSACSTSRIFMILRRHSAAAAGLPNLQLNYAYFLLTCHTCRFTNIHSAVVAVFTLGDFFLALEPPIASARTCEFVLLKWQQPKFLPQCSVLSDVSFYLYYFWMSQG